MSKMHLIMKYSVTLLTLLLFCSLSAVEARPTRCTGTCPAACTCTCTWNKQDFTVICKNGNHTTIPTIPPGTTRLVLDGNKELTALKAYAFNGTNFHHLRVLSLQGCSLNYIHTSAFVGLVQLRELDFSRNNLTVIQRAAFMFLEKLTTLDMRDNNVDCSKVKSEIEKMLSKKLAYFYCGSTNVPGEDLSVSMSSTSDRADREGRSVSSSTSTAIVVTEDTTTVLLPSPAEENFYIESSAIVLSVIVVVLLIACGIVAKRKFSAKGGSRQPQYQPVGPACMKHQISVLEE